MWVFGTMGILMPSKRPDHVTPKGDPRTIQIRGRVKVHLERFRRDYCNARTEGIQHGGMGPIHFTPNMDYQYRAYCSPEDFSIGLGLMVADIDWTKFKPQTEIQYRDKKLHSFYTHVWGEMLHDWPVGSSFSYGKDRRVARSNVGGKARGGRHAAKAPSYGGSILGTFKYNNDGSVTNTRPNGEVRELAAGSVEAQRERYFAGLQKSYPGQPNPRQVFGSNRPNSAPGTQSLWSASASHASRFAAEEPDLFDDEDVDLDALVDEIIEGEVVEDNEEQLAAEDMDEALIEELVTESIQPGSFLSEFAEDVQETVMRVLRQRAAAKAALPSGSPGTDQLAPGEALTSIAAV